MYSGLWEENNYAMLDFAPNYPTCLINSMFLALLNRHFKLKPGIKLYLLNLCECGCHACVQRDSQRDVHVSYDIGEAGIAVGTGSYRETIQDGFH